MSEASEAAVGFSVSIDHAQAGLQVFGTASNCTHPCGRHAMNRAAACPATP